MMRQRPTRALSAEEYEELRQFARAAGDVPNLTAAEERRLLIDAQAGSVAARDEIITRNLRTLVYVAIPFAGHGYPLADLIMESTDAMMHAIAKFDTAQPWRLSTYALTIIRRRLVRITTQDARKSDLIDSMDAAQLGDHSVNEWTFHDLIPDVKATDPEASAIATVSHEETAAVVRALLDRLARVNAPGAELLRLHYGIDHAPHTMREIGVMLGVSRQRVEQRIKRARKQLRDIAEALR